MIIMQYIARQCINLLLVIITPPTEIYPYYNTHSLHDDLPISSRPMSPTQTRSGLASLTRAAIGPKSRLPKSHSRNSTSCRPRFLATSRAPREDRKSTRLNSSTNAHLVCRLILETTHH